MHLQDDFLQRLATPQRAFQLERRLARLLWEVERRVIQRAYNACEPDNQEQMPGRLRLGLEDCFKNPSSARHSINRPL